MILKQIIIQSNSYQPWNTNHQHNKHQNPTNLTKNTNHHHNKNQNTTNLQPTNLTKREKNYDEKFDYPVHGNINILIDQLERGEKPDVDPYRNHDYSFLITNEQKCSSVEYSLPREHNFTRKRENIFLVILVKSAASNFKQRSMIRRTWGKESNQFQQLRTKTMFTLGRPTNSKIDAVVTAENNQYHDLIQGDFVDNYFNNTVKTLMTFRWLYRYCDNAKYYLFVDDDYYISVKNALKFLRNESKFNEHTYYTVGSVTETNLSKGKEVSIFILLY